MLKKIKKLMHAHDWTNTHHNAFIGAPTKRVCSKCGEIQLRSVRSVISPNGTRVYEATRWGSKRA